MSVVDKCVIRNTNLWTRQSIKDSLKRRVAAVSHLSDPVAPKSLEAVGGGVC